MSVSVIVPVYCRDELSLVWLEECLRSVEDQKCDVVVYNDGSLVDISKVTDNCRIDTLLSGDRNIGVAYARNVAAKHVNTDLLVPLDCDDRFRSDAIEKLLGAWDGVPVYSDVSKFGIESYPHYELPDFHCDHIVSHVGFSSVNVLHSRDQWKTIQGWNETLDFFEDGEYNARLFSRFCGIRVPEPLVEYRQHDQQRTKQYRSRSASYARTILSSIRRLEMACPGCGKRSTPVSRQDFAAAHVAKTPAPAMKAATVDPATLPGEIDGRVLAQYIGGKGKGKHYYQGVSTKFSYKVTYGDYVYADPSDVRMPDNMGHLSLLVKIIQEKKPVVTVEKTVKKHKSEPIVSRQPVKDGDRIAVIDIGNMTVDQVIEAVRDSNPPKSYIKGLIVMEERNKNRKSLLAYLRPKVK